MAPFGVKVLCIEPGFFRTTVTDTDIICKNVRMLWHRLPQDVKDDYGPDFLEKSKFGSSFFFSIAFVFNESIYQFS